MLRKIFYCDRCGKEITGELRMHNNQHVGKEGRLMIHISKDSCTGGPTRQETMYFCQECWGRIIQAVKKVILRDDEKGKAKVNCNRL